MKNALLLLALLTSQLRGQPVEQSLIGEVRQIRHDLKTMARIAQQIQILIQEVRMQQQLVDDLTEYHGEFVKTRPRIELWLKTEQDSLRRNEEDLLKNQNNPMAVELLRNIVERTVRLRFAPQVDQMFRDMEAASEADLNKAKSKLSELQDKLDQLDNQLQ